MKTQLTDFTFIPCAFGHYQVTHTSPVTGSKWLCTMCDMMLIDVTKNSDTPKRKDLERLKRLVKSGRKL